MKKLIPALCMLLVAAALLGTSTFAWFSMNTDVQAEGMTVKAVASASLAIKGSEDTGFTAVGTNTIDQADMKPATSADGATFAKLADAVKVGDANDSSATWNGTDGAFQAADLETVELTNTEYVIASEYKIKSIAATKTVYVSNIEVTGTNEALLPAVRVAVKSNAGTLIFNPNSGTLNDEGKAGKLVGDAWTLAAPTYTDVNTANASIGSFTADVEQNVTVYVWFEGQDTACTSNNVDATGFEVTVHFTTNTPN